MKSIFLIFSTLLIVSCNKAETEELSAFANQSVEINSEWQLESYTQFGKDITDDYNMYESLSIKDKNHFTQNFYDVVNGEPTKVSSTTSFFDLKNQTFGENEVVMGKIESSENRLKLILNGELAGIEVTYVNAYTNF